MDTSDLANRMKEYEKRNQYYLQKRTPVAIRVDGRSFHTFTKGFKRPFDDILVKTMQGTAKYMCENIQGAKFAYVQSDEITIILVDYDTLETDCWFNYRTDKLCSIAASMATMAFNKFFAKNANNYYLDYIDNRHVTVEDTIYFDKLSAAIEKGAMFDARCFNIPKEEVTNLIYWRQLDASRNSVEMVGRAYFSHNELMNKSCSNIQDMLMKEFSINWNDYPTYLKRGSACLKNINGGWFIDLDMPMLKGENRSYVDNLIYVGED